MSGSLTDDIQNVREMQEYSLGIVRPSVKDFLGNELNIGDNVACIELDYKNLVKGEVVKLTPTAVRVKWQHWGKDKITLRYSNQVIKILVV